MPSLIKHFRALPLVTKIITFFVFLIVIYFTYTKFFVKKSTTPQYQTAIAEKGTLIVSLTSSGSVAATNSRTVTTTASGVVKKIFVKEGDKVYTGAPILEIDLDLDGRQKLQSAFSSYLSAQNNLKSTQDKIYSLQSDLVSAKNIFDNQWSMQSPDDPTYIQKHNAYLTAQAAYNNLQNTIRQQQASLESSRLSYQLASAIVYAPITGTVSAISLTPGMILNPTSTNANSSNSENKIAIVKTNTTPAVTVSLSEIDVPKVHVGDKVTITLDAFPTKTFTGKVIAVDTAGSVSSNVVNYPTTIQFDSDVPEILSNMSATANIITSIKNDVIIVPSAAVLTSNNLSTVRILKNNQMTSVDVEIGLSNSTQTEIISGINEGDIVITNINSTSTTTNRTGTSGSVFGNTRGGFFGGPGR